jgi:hypothetical protein
MYDTTNKIIKHVKIKGHQVSSLISCGVLALSREHKDPLTTGKYKESEIRRESGQLTTVFTIFFT